MRVNVRVWKLVVVGAAMTLGSAGAADAKVRTPHARPSGPAASHAQISPVNAGGLGAKRVRIGGHGRKEAYLGHRVSYSYGGGLQCVPFARENSGIELAGNAAYWWSAAAGAYERGSRPEVGSILNFRANGRMRSGHVAVVSNVESARTVEVDQANWANHGEVTRNVTVVDVSPDNDWSAVRVQLGDGETFGSVYPTYGFIYDRPDRGTMVANNAVAPMPNALNPAPSDLRPASERVAAGEEPVEVAEAFTRVRYRSLGRPSYRYGHTGETRVAHRKSEYGSQGGWGRSRRKF